MKKILLSIFSSCIAIFATAQFEANFSYSMAIPVKEMGHNINLTHSGVADIRYHFKKAAEKLWVGAQFGLGVYAITNQEQTYQFANGSTTQANVNFTSNVFNSHAIAGIDLVSGKPITPYITAKGGFSKFYTRIYIPDPNDQDGCKPLESKSVYKDGTWSAGAGAGVKISGSTIVKKGCSNNWWIDFSANYLTGGSVNYLNVTHLMDHNDNTAPTADSKGYNVTFVNVTTNEIHQHQVAELLTSRINQIDLKLGLLFRL
jgi:hypothetical protein